MINGSQQPRRPADTPGDADRRGAARNTNKYIHKMLELPRALELVQPVSSAPAG